MCGLQRTVDQQLAGGRELEEAVMARASKKGAGTASPQGVKSESLLFVNSFAKGLRVLEAFNVGRRSLSLSQLAEVTGLEKSGVQRFTYTLHTLGYLHKDPLTRHYSLGPKTLQLGSTYLRSFDLVARAQPMLVACNEALGETINLSRMEETDIVYVARVPSKHAVNIDIMLGTRLPAYCAAMGRAMLAYLPPEEVDDIFSRSEVRSYTPKTTTDLPELYRKLEEVRRDGFAITDSEIHLGDVSIAAPVFDASRQAIASVGIALPSSRWTTKRVRTKLAPLILKASEMLTSQSPPLTWPEEIQKLAHSALAP